MFGTDGPCNWWRVVDQEYEAAVCAQDKARWASSTIATSHAAVIEYLRRVCDAFDGCSAAEMADLDVDRARTTRNREEKAIEYAQGEAEQAVLGADMALRALEVALVGAHNAAAVTASLLRVNNMHRRREETSRGSEAWRSRRLLALSLRQDALKRVDILQAMVSRSTLVLRNTLPAKQSVVGLLTQVVTRNETAAVVRNARAVLAADEQRQGRWAAVVRALVRSKLAPQPPSLTTLMD